MTIRNQLRTANTESSSYVPIGVERTTTFRCPDCAPPKDLQIGGRATLARQYKAWRCGCNTEPDRYLRVMIHSTQTGNLWRCPDCAAKLTGVAKAEILATSQRFLPRN